MGRPRRLASTREALLLRCSVTMDIDPNWFLFLGGEGALAWVTRYLFGPPIQRVLMAYADRHARLVEAGTDAKVEAKKDQLALEAEARREETSMTPVPELLALASRLSTPTFDVTVDETLLRLPSLEERARSYQERVNLRALQNLEAILVRMLNTPPPSGDPGARRPSKTWLNEFADAARAAEEDDVRERWARLLAGEVMNPGSYSVKTLDVLRYLSSEDAALFDHVCSYAFEKGLIAQEDPIFGLTGITYETILRLNAVDLIHPVPASWNAQAAPGMSAFQIQFCQRVISVGGPPSHARISVPAFAFTKAGMELRRLTTRVADAEYLEWFVGYLRWRQPQLEIALE